jgi:hypothetical protein
MNWAGPPCILSKITLQNSPTPAVLRRSQCLLVIVGGDVEDGAAFIDQALVRNPNLAAGWLFSAWGRIFLGEPDVTVEHAARAMRFSPLDPLIFLGSSGIGGGHFIAGRYDEASWWAEKGLREGPNWAGAARMAAASHALAGRLDQAHKAMARLGEHVPQRLVQLRRCAVEQLLRPVGAQ